MLIKQVRQCIAKGLEKEKEAGGRNCEEGGLVVSDFIRLPASPDSVSAVDPLSRRFRLASFLRSADRSSRLPCLTRDIFKRDAEVSPKIQYNLDSNSARPLHPYRCACTC